MKAAVLFNSSLDLNAPEEEDTLMQAQEITHWLQELGFKTRMIPFAQELQTTENDLKAWNPRFVFNLVESVNGTDRLAYTAPAILEFLKLPYTGCSAESMAETSCKIRQKKRLQQASIPTPLFWGEENSNESSIDGPFIVKSTTEHASVGIHEESVTSTLADAIALVEKLKLSSQNNHWFIERYIDGREFNISLLEMHDKTPEVLPPSEILFINFPEHLPKIVDYKAKWDTTSFSYHATERCFNFKNDDELLLEKLKIIAVKCWDLFELRGAARVDIRVDKQGNPWVLEVNTNPCLSSDAGLMAAAKKAGLTAQNVIQRLIPKAVL